MKKLLISLLILTLGLSCKEAPTKQKAYYNLEVTYIDGNKETITTEQPMGTTFGIYGTQGVYHLVKKEQGLLIDRQKVIKSGIIRYKVISIQPLED